MRYKHLDKFFSESNDPDSSGIKKEFTQQEINRAIKELGIDFTKYDREQFLMGLKVELEHGKIFKNWNVTDDDVIRTAKIAMAHLEELPDYYTRLKKMEEEGEAALEKTPDKEKEPKIPNEEDLPPEPKSENFNYKLQELYGISYTENETIDKNSAYVLIFNKEKHILMIRRKESKWWGFPGGKVERDETNRDAAIREAKEEVNVNISEIIPIPDYRDSRVSDGIKIIRNMFIAIKWDGEPKLLDTAEHDEMKWIPINELFENKDFNNANLIMFKHNFNPYVKPLIDKYIK